MAGAGRALIAALAVGCRGATPTRATTVGLRRGAGARATRAGPGRTPGAVTPQDARLGSRTRFITSPKAGGLSAALIKAVSKAGRLNCVQVGRSGGLNGAGARGGRTAIARGSSFLVANSATAPSTSAAASVGAHGRATGVGRSGMARARVLRGGGVGRRLAGRGRRSRSRATPELAGTSVPTSIKSGAALPTSEGCGGERARLGVRSCRA